MSAGRVQVVETVRGRARRDALEAVCFVGMSVLTSGCGGTRNVATLVSRCLWGETIYTAEFRETGISWEVTMEGRWIVDQLVEHRSPRCAPTLAAAVRLR